jgi:hypothetical protein
LTALKRTLKYVWFGDMETIGHIKREQMLVFPVFDFEGCFQQEQWNKCIFADAG